ncbi:MAG: hypothetical protein IJK46_01020 [Prevotella sp.]|nr:hypothetical protein [Prevotella sp.]
MKESSLRNSTVTVKVMCAIVFLVFTFCFLFFYQAESLTYLQHVLSGGRTHYDRTVGGIILILILILVQQAVYRITHLYKRGHALTYFPSILILTVLTDVTTDGHIPFHWVWLSPLLLIAFVALAWLSKQFETYEPGQDNPGLFSRQMWINMLTMFVMFLFACLFSNRDEVLHNRLKAEMLIQQKQYQQASEVGKRSHETDSSLTMLRVYALAQTGQLGSRLFEYPIVGGQDVMQPNGTSVKPLMISPNQIRLMNKNRKTRNDCLLTKHLLACDLDAFARDIKKTYDIDSVPLPRHYREALVLYTHLRSHRVLTYHDSVLDADYEDLRKLQRRYPDLSARQTAIRDTYGNTYWHYYLMKK